MSVILSNTEVGPCRRELIIEVPAPAVEAESERVLASLRQKVNVPGFRRGKVPPHVVRLRYKEDIRQETLERLVPRYWHQAEAEAGLEPLLAPKVSQVEHEAGSTLTFVATVEVRPEIEIRNITDFSLPPVEVEPSREEIERALDDLRRAQGEWKVVDRAATRGDLIEGEVTDLAPHHHGDGEAAEPEARPATFEVGNPKVWEELSLAATGVPAGREVEFSRQHEGGEGGAHEHKYRLKIHAVKEMELAPLEDGLATKLGLESLEKLRGEIEARLRHAKQLDNRRRREQALLDQLRDRHPMPLPEWVVDNEVQVILTEYAEELARQGVDIERAPIDWAELSQQARPQGERRVHSRLLLDAVAKAESIKVSEEEFEATLAALARSQGRPAGLVRRELDEAGKLGPLKAQMRRERTVRYLLGEAPPTLASPSLAEITDGGA